ncbi:MAG: PD-(D/E)XK nuclease family protein, partial [Selenomonadaceae bacterium]|nr:PD-(D/E)XK nuclease family protein [Selenomonadaceae bacterium]
RAELELAELTGGAVNTRMNSFSRFARQILDETGGGLAVRLSEIGRRLLLRKILLRRDKSRDLKFFTRAVKQRGFTELLADELKELRTYSIDAEKLSHAADAVDNDELKDKLRDLATLTEDFRAALTDKLTDDENLLERATEFLPQSPTISSAEIFIDGFIFFDPQQRNFLRQLFKCAANVHITLPMDTDLNSRENVLDVGIFNRSFQTLKTIRDLANEVHVEHTITRLETPRRFKADTLKILERQLFERKTKIFNGNGGLKFVEAFNKRAEVEACAREILRLVKCGYRLRDIGIIFRDEIYFALIKPIFELHALPFFADIKRPATHHPLAELIRSALEVLHGWRREAVFRCLRTGFFAAEATQIDLLENYVVEFGIKGASNWKRPWDYLRVKNLDEPTRPANDDEIKFLDTVNEVRKKVSAPLAKFAERIKTADDDVVALTTALFNLLEDLHVHEKLDEWARAEELRGNLAQAREHEKIWDDVINLFEQVVDALGDEKISTREFESIIGEGLDALEMSLIPPGLDEVTVAQFDQNSLQNSRALFVLGFSDENFPRKFTEKNLLDDADRMRMNDAGTEISRGGHEKALAEKFLIYRGLNSARELLQISWPIASDNGEKISPSNLATRLQKIFPNVPTEKISLDVLSNLGSEIEFALTEKILSPDTAKKLYAPEKSFRGSVSKIEKFNECPFKFFATHGLNLQERVEYKVQAPDIGNILHAVMSRFGRELKNENRPWSSVEKKEVNLRVEKILTDVLPKVHNKILSSTKTLEHRRERIKKVAVESLTRLIELDKVSNFQPKIFEAPFDDGNLKIGDTALDLSGRIDRIDLSDDGKYFLIVDYKTGKAALKLEKIFHGLSLQLAVYLNAAKNLPEVDGREGVAMLYCLLKIPSTRGLTDEEANSNAVDELKMPGLIRVDESIRNAVDRTQKFVDFKKNNLAAREELQTIVDYAEKILLTTAERILDGCIDIKPAKSSDEDACEYCLFSALCNFDRAVNETTTVKKIDREEIFKRMNEFLTDG